MVNVRLGSGVCPSRGFSFRMTLVKKSSELSFRDGLFSFIVSRKMSCREKRLQV